MATPTVIDALEVTQGVEALRAGCALLTRVKGMPFEDKKRIIEALSWLVRSYFIQLSDAFCNGYDLGCLRRKTSRRIT